MNKNEEHKRKQALLELAVKYGITDAMRASMAMFGRDFETSTPEQVRQALTDAYISTIHRARVAQSKAMRGNPHRALSQEELDVIQSFHKAAGTKQNKSKR